MYALVVQGDKRDGSHEGKFGLLWWRYIPAGID
jgi:hypothetical protein